MHVGMAAALLRRGHLSFSRGEAGASAVEYGLLVAGIAAVIALTVYLFGGGVLELFQDTCDAVGSAASAGSC